MFVRSTYRITEDATQEMLDVAHRRLAWPVLICHGLKPLLDVTGSLLRRAPVRTVHSAPRVPGFANGYEAYHWTMTRMHPKCTDLGPSARPIAADVLLRQDPDEEEEEDEGDGKGDDGDNDEEDGYSE